MKKTIIILFLILLTGCDATYNLEINDTAFEKIKIVESGLGDNDTELLLNLKRGFSLYNDNDNLKYKAKFKRKDNISEILLEGNFPELNNKSKAVLTACTNYNVKLDDKYLELSASNFKIFEKYYNMNSITVNIKSKYEVKESNADYVKDNVYTWVINAENYDTKDILIIYKVHENIIESLSKNIKGDNPMNGFIIVLFALVLLFYIIYIVMKNRRNNVNKL